MLRVVVRVEPDGSDWSVRVQTSDPSGNGSALVSDLVPPYTMTAMQLESRRVPATPPQRAPAPDAAHAQLCAGDAAAAADLLERLRTGRTEAQDVELYGRWLFECLLAPAWPAVTEHPSVVAARAVELALSWPVDATDLHRLVWEAMYDAKAPLVGHPDRLVAVTRLVPGPVTDVEEITGVPRVLFVAGSPLTDRTIRPGAMFMGLLRALDASGRCRSFAIQNASIEDLRAACERFTPDVVHLVAHGELLENGRGALMLRGQSDDGPEEEADAKALVAAVSAGRPPRAIVLSACNTASPGESSMDPADASPLAAQLVQAGIPIVSAMAGEVGERACRLYTRRLAEAIHEGRSVVEASAHGRRAALVSSPAPSADINWALPTLYLAEGLDPGARLVDKKRATKVLELANGLGLRREPVFIGREKILAEADRLVDPDAEAGVVAALAKASTAGQGGTRLLQEIGWRLIRDGHIPVLLGPYANPATAPKTVRALVHEILARVITITEKMDLELDVPMILWADPQCDVDTLRAQVEAAPRPSVARTRVRKALAELRDRPGDLDPTPLRDLLADDLLDLAVRARAWGPPFGEHTRVVLLCDDVHAWATLPETGSAALPGALDGLLAMLDASGLGRTGKPVPVVVTGSKTADGGPALKTWSEKAGPGFRMMLLDDLSTDDAVLGFQWVLLHPWTTKQEDGERELFGGTYTASPGKAELWEEALRTLGGRPTKVEEHLYVVASSHVATKTCRRDDDERAWRLYADENPGYQL